MAQLRSLVLNTTFEALSTVSAARAIQLVHQEKAQLLAAYDRVLRSPTAEFTCPSVILLRRYVKVPPPRPHSITYSRRRVLQRDHFCCQYCGETSLKELTVDHVIPRSRGGSTTFCNTVTACKKCNNKKGSRLLSETGMKLRTKPGPPVATMIPQRPDHPGHWHKYLATRNIR
mmetsp:Transcript_13061/g.48483  ORF Transcript_13061/g.48483 Transcript_13061/m.48483 type:complete len:173 (-) Transcript_13061:1782-2300(-)|eukprot:scaffold2544_cov245-Pinguiococcus_pyrenoidosus.AAC.13